ncbi:MAG: SGNH/GDSL hydrolase family protein [Lentisphaeria bacterium]|nr:SGNH/GDSL hydrolase family protein [Lentisphaeria bacterium]
MFGCKKSKIALFFVWVFAVSVLAAAPRLQSKLLLPEKIYAVPGIESNIYYDNIFHTHNPANYSFEFLCKKGNNGEKRWYYMPRKGDEGTYDVTLRVWDDDGVVAEAKSQLIVTPADAGKDKEFSLMIVGCSGIAMYNAYPTHVYNLFRQPGNPKLTMVGETGPGWPDKIGEIRHEGYGGWSFLTFTTSGRIRGKSPHMRENPFWNFQTKSLDFAAYFKKNNGGKAPDIITVTLGGNDTFSGKDDTIEKIISGVKQRAVTFFTALRKAAPNARIAIVMPYYIAASQDAFGYNYGTAGNRWQFKKNYRAYMLMMLALAKERKDLKLDVVLTSGATDNENNVTIHKIAPNARNKAVKIKRIGNALHPLPAGYQQSADVFYCWVKYIYHQQKAEKLPGK